MSLKWIPLGFLAGESPPTIQEIHGSVYTIIPEKVAVREMHGSVYTATPEEVGVREIHGSIFVKLP